MSRIGGISLWLRNTAPVVTGLPVTMACWFYAPNVTSNIGLMTLGGMTKNERLTLTAAGTVAGDPIRAQSADSANTIRRAASSAGFSATTWHHAAAVFASATSRAAYLDGGNKGTNATSTATSGLDVIDVGAEHANGVSQSWATNCELAECAIWDVALSDEEVAILAAGYSPLFVRPLSLKNYYPLFGSGGSASNEEDWMGNNLLSRQSTPEVGGQPRIIYPSRRQLARAVGAAMPTFRAAWVPRASQFIGAR